MQMCHFGLFLDDERDFWIAHLLLEYPVQNLQLSHPRWKQATTTHLGKTWPDDPCSEPPNTPLGCYVPYQTVDHLTHYAKEIAASPILYEWYQLSVRVLAACFSLRPLFPLLI